MTALHTALRMLRTLRFSAPYSCPTDSLISVLETPATSSHTPHTPQANSTITPKTTVEVNGLPLLNLEGPPPALGASPTKKKRKRNKKKKKRHMEGGEAQVSADRDAEAQGEEEDDE